MTESAASEAKHRRIHGGSVSAHGGVVLDVSTCIDAFGILEPVAQALDEVNARRAYASYPDPCSVVSRKVLAAVCECDPSMVDVGPGAAEILWSVVRMFATDVQARGAGGLSALTWEPCFSEFAYAVRAVGGSVSEQRFASDAPVEAQLQALSRAIARERPNVVYACAPTSPRGQWVPATMLVQLTEEHRSTHFVLDQSYLSLSQHVGDLALRFPSNVICVRSLTKELATPGVRVGYALMQPLWRERLQAQRPTWVMGAHAQALIDAYPRCQPLLRQRAILLRRHTVELARQIRALGLRAELEDTHYFAVRHLDASKLAATLAARERVLVRDCTSFGMPDAFRVSAHPKQQRLIRALQAVLVPTLGCSPAGTIAPLQHGIVPDVDAVP